MKVIVRRRGDQLVTRIVNDTLGPVAGVVEFGWWRLDGSNRDLKSIRVELKANGA